MSKLFCFSMHCTNHLHAELRQMWKWADVYVSENRLEHDAVTCNQATWQRRVRKSGMTRFTQFALIITVEVVVFFFYYLLKKGKAIPVSRLWGLMGL
jgi:hypothetical protein